MQKGHVLHRPVEAVSKGSRVPGGQEVVLFRPEVQVPGRKEQGHPNRGEETQNLEPRRSGRLKGPEG